MDACWVVYMHLTADQRPLTVSTNLLMSLSWTTAIAMSCAVVNGTASFFHSSSMQVHLLCDSRMKSRKHTQETEEFYGCFLTAPLIVAISWPMLVVNLTNVTWSHPIPEVVVVGHCIVRAYPLMRDQILKDHLWRSFKRATVLYVFCWVSSVYEVCITQKVGLFEL